MTASPNRPFPLARYTLTARNGLLLIFDRHQIRLPVAVQIARTQPGNFPCRGDDLGRRKRAVALSAQQCDRGWVRRLVSVTAADDHVEEPVTVEVVDDDVTRHETGVELRSSSNVPSPLPRRMSERIVDVDHR